jgi:hypothetical protein
LIEWEKDHFVLLETAPGFSAEEVMALSDMAMTPAAQVKAMA